MQLTRDERNEAECLIAEFAISESDYTAAKKILLDLINSGSGVGFDLAVKIFETQKEILEEEEKKQIASFILIYCPESQLIYRIEDLRYLDTSSNYSII